MASVPMDVEQWSSVMVALLARLLKKLCPGGLLLGHFKASLSLGAGFIYANTTGGDPLVRLSADLPPETPQGLLKIALIVYELDPKAVQQAFDEALATVFEQWGLRGEVQSMQGECHGAETASS